MGLSLEGGLPLLLIWRELKKLDCFVNYDISSGKGRSWRYGWVWYQSAQTRGKVWGSRLSGCLCQVFSVIGSIVFLVFQVLWISVWLGWRILFLVVFLLVSYGLVSDLLIFSLPCFMVLFKLFIYFVCTWFSLSLVLNIFPYLPIKNIFVLKDIPYFNLWSLKLPQIVLPSYPIEFLLMYYHCYCPPLPSLF